MNFRHGAHLEEFSHIQQTLPAPPANAYVTEDGATYYVTEDGFTYYTQE